MKKLVILFSLVSLVFSCSSNDDNNDDGDPGMLQGHYTLRINGDGLSDEIYLMDRDTVEGGSLGLKFTASDNNGNSLFFAIPTAEEGTQYSIVPYVSGTTSTASIILQGNGIYLSEDGNVTLTEVDINFEENCQITKGNFSINFRRQDNQPGTINVQGSFDVPTYSCGLDN